MAVKYSPNVKIIRANNDDNSKFSIINNQGAIDMPVIKTENRSAIKEDIDNFLLVLPIIIFKSAALY